MFGNRTGRSQPNHLSETVLDAWSLVFAEVVLHHLARDIPQATDVDLSFERIFREERVQVGIILSETERPLVAVAVDLGR